MEHRGNDIKPGPPVTESITLMRQLARMANLDMARIRRMVLVLDVKDCPRLFTEGFLVKDRQEELVPTELAVEEKAIIVDTTSMQNQRWTTKQEVGD